MQRTLSFVVVCLFCVFLPSSSRAQDVTVPAGTLLRCTMSEPNFSTATVDVGDPVLCHLGSVTSFGRIAFPRGAYMSGHLEDAKEPGHFVGKGYLKIVFDRIGLPNTDVQVGTKVISAQGFKVDKQGDILGKGHAKRDVIEWLIPPLWPWKLLMLPARGPRPKLKGEETLTLRLMEDVTIPHTIADWRPPRPVYAPQNFPRASVRPSGSIITPAKPAPEVSMIPASATLTPIVAPAAAAEPTVVLPPPALDSRSASRLTLIALKSETIYAVTDYWVEGDHLRFTLPSGGGGQFSLNDLDLANTTELNSERGINVTLRTNSGRQTF